mmetsp:Transcript_14439/g.21177  ORF Transcript_14439/g.21177 Transcript_14439/m.21177 type:complete len:500 (+) Transcript_14439:2-1501(+)
MTKKWKRLRKVCDPFFAAAQFQDRTDDVIQHIIDAVTLASKEAAPGKIEYFQLINRLVVEVHLMAILGVKSIPPSGQNVDLCDKEELAEGKTDGGCAGGIVCMANTIDRALEFKGVSPCSTCPTFAPVLNYLLERLEIPKDQLGGIEKILAQAQNDGKVSCVERLHNCIMYMIALAPSPGAFWATVHIFNSNNLLQVIHEEADKDDFSMLAKCVKETLRMYAPVPIMIERYVVDEHKANQHLLLDDGVGLSKGDQIIIPTIIIQNDPELWASPDEFRPERWGEVSAEAPTDTKLNTVMRRGSGVEARPVKQNEGNSRARYFPFGMGKHLCQGQPYAVWLTMVIVSTIAINFDVELSDPEGIMDEEHSYQRLREHIYSFPKHPLFARITPHRGKEAKEAKSRTTNFRKSVAMSANDIAAFVDADGHKNVQKSTRKLTFAVAPVIMENYDMFDDDDMSDDDLPPLPLQPTRLSGGLSRMSLARSLTLARICEAAEDTISTR